MKTWLVIVSVVAVLLVASTGVGFWMLTDAKAELVDTRAELTDIKADLTDTEAELTEIQENLEENGGYWWETEPSWMGASAGEYPWSGLSGASEGETISDLELRIDDLEWTVRDLEWTVRDLESQLQQLESTLHIHGIY